MVAIHQFVPTLATRDAVGSHYLQIRDTLRAAGFASDIYAMEVKRELKGQGLPYTSFAGARAGEPTWLLYQSSVGCPVAEFVRDRPEPLMVDYHNITPASFFAGWEDHVAIRLNAGRRQLRELAARAELGLADSAYNARELDELGYRASAVVPILLDTATFAGAADPELSTRLAARPGHRWLFVGRISPNKCQHDVMKAFAAYRRCYDPRATLTLVGGSSSHAYETALHAYCDALGVRDAVEFAGSVSHAQLVSHYEQADVFVCLSEHEGFCVPLLEAMYHRLPIVAYAEAAVPETLGGAGLLLPSKSPFAVAAAADRLIRDPAVRAEAVTRGERRLADFDLATGRRALLDAVGSVVGSRV